MKRAVLFTGLIRDEDNFLRFLEAYAAGTHAASVPLYLSTWDGELAKYPRAAAMLRTLGAVVFEQPAPDLVIPGHMVHQLVSWDLPLARLEPDVFLYKSRPDFAYYRSFEQFMAYVPRPAEGGEGQAWRYLVAGLFLSQPFYIGDITFAGAVADLRRLTRLAFVDLVRYFRMAPEQLAWTPQFVHGGSVLDAYLRVNLGLMFNEPAKSHANTSWLKMSQTYAAALAFYFDAVARRFDFFDGDCDWDPEAGARLRTLTADDLLWHNLEMPHLAHHANCGANRVNAGVYVRALLDGNYAPSAFGALLREFAVDPGRAPPAEVVARETARYADFGRAALQINGAKAIAPTLDGYAVRSAADWRQVGLGTSATAHLEAENNNLRRTLGGMEAELGRLRRQAAS